MNIVELLEVIAKGRSIKSVGYTSVTVAATAGSLFSLADSGMITQKPATAKSFVGVLETGQIRARGDGAAPTSSEGQVIQIGQAIYLDESEIGTMLFIRTGGTSGVIKGHYYDCEVSVLLGGVR